MVHMVSLALRRVVIFTSGLESSSLRPEKFSKRFLLMVVVYALFLPCFDFFRIIRKGGVPHRGVPQKCVRGRASGATVCSGHMLRVFNQSINQSIYRYTFIYSIIETRHVDLYPNQFGYSSDTYQCAPALCLEAVPFGVPPL